MEEMVFQTIAPASVRIRIGEDRYILKEASEAAACEYRSANMRNSELSQTPDGRVSLKRLNQIVEVEPMLVSLCLYKVKPDETLELVPLATIRGWPSSIVRRLYDKLREISPGLDEKETEEVLERQLKLVQKRLDDLRRDNKNGAATSNGAAEDAQKGADPTSTSPASTPSS